MTMPERIEKAVEYLGALVDETKSLRAEVASDRRERQQTTRRFLAVLVALTMCVAVMVTLALMNRVLLTRQAEIAHQLKDCTTPAGKCFQDGQKRTGGAIQEIANRNRETNLQLVACAQMVRGVEALRECIAEQVAQ